MTLEEIAALAGVSRATVSRVINNQPRVSAATRERVWQIIREQGYQPHIAARTLASRRSQTLGLVMPTALPNAFSSPYYLILMQGVATACEQRGYNLMLWPLVSQTPDACGRVIRNGQVDGLVVTTSSVGDAFLERLQDAGYPFFLVGRHLTRSDMNTVTADNPRGGYLVGEHLARLGYTRIAAITGPRSHGSAVDRRDGFLAALHDAGLDCPPQWLVEGQFDERSGEEGMRRLLALRPRPQAVFCASDLTAIGALKAAHGQGLRVPDDIALVGFDDVPLATAIDPALTTVRQPIQELGSLAASMLIERLRAGEAHGRRALPPQHTTLPVELVVRESCGQGSPLPAQTAPRAGALP